MNSGSDYYSLLQKKEELLAQLSEVESKISPFVKKSGFEGLINGESSQFESNKEPNDDYAILVTDEDLGEQSFTPPTHNFLSGNQINNNNTWREYLKNEHKTEYNHDVLRTGKPTKSEGELYFGKKAYNLEFIKTPLLINGNTKKVLTLIKDISKNKDQTNELLMSVINNMDDFAVIKDLNQKIIAANNSYIKAAGKKNLGELMGKSEQELFGETQDCRKNQREDEIAKKLKRGESIESEGRFVFYDRTVIDTLVKRFPIYNNKEEIIATASILRDVTSLKNEHRKLARSEEKYRMLIENQGEGACIVDGFDKFVYANSAAESLFDVKKGGLIDCSLKEFINEKDFNIIESKIKSSELGEANTFEIEINSFKSVKKYVILTVSSFYNGSGSLVGSFFLFRDITERRRIEEELQKSELSLKETIATKDKFFSILAHDLKNPFGSIMGFSELILRKTQTNNIEKITHYAQIIHSASQHGFELLENLLAWSRSQNGTIKYSPTKVSLQDIIKHNVKVLSESAAHKHISVTLLKSEDIDVYIDEDMINTVLRNLLSNAIKYSNTDGEITILASKSDSHEAKISIADQGVGMNKSHLDLLFRIDSNKSTPGTSGEQGTGLGLILCKEFVEKNKGKIWAESSPGSGSIFSFTVPLF